MNNDIVDDGILKCRTCSAEYPIINGVPRFVDKEHYSKSFGYEWKKWSRVQFESENIGKPFEGHTLKMFTAITHFAKSDIKGKTVIEFGCGGGRFLDIVRSFGGIAVGIDMSIAVEAARDNFRNDPDVLIVQGDVLNPPFRMDSFDIGYSIGVLHHTPAPARGFKVLADLVKRGGKISCCVYPKGGFYDYQSVARFRNIHKRIGQLLGDRIAIQLALCYAYFASYAIGWALHKLASLSKNGANYSYHIQKNYIVYLDLPDIRWRILDIFDAITPYYASTHTSAEVLQWFIDSSCEDIKMTSWCDTSFAGIKK